jgi:two-component system, OmpR family, sensor histidine kinase VicK
VTIKRTKTNSGCSSKTFWWPFKRSNSGKINFLSKHILESIFSIYIFIFIDLLHILQDYSLKTESNTVSSSSSDTNIEEQKIEVLYGAENIIKRTLGDLQNIRERFDNCTDFTGPSVFIETPIWNEYLKLKDRGIKLRFITEITKDNIHYCKELMKVADLRHLDGVKGNFGIADGKDYGGGASVQEAHVPTQLIRSNLKTFVEQQQYFFETLWSKAIPAEQKIMEIEEGVIPIRTKLLKNQDEIIKEIKRKNNAAKKLSICTSLGGMQMSYNYLFDSYKNVVDKYKNGESKEGMRWLMNIEDKKEEGISLVKKFLDSGIQMKHIKNTPPLSFGVSDKEVAITIEKMEGGKMSQSFLISNEPLYVSHFNSLFDELWKKGIDATERIKIIEEGIESTNIEIIENPVESLKLSYDIVRSAKNEVLRIYPSINAFRRQVRAGAMHLFKEILDCNVGVRILIPADDQQIMNIMNEVILALPELNIRSIDKSLQTSIGIIIVDKKESLIIESRDDTRDNYYDAAGLAAYSNSKPIALSYASIFETLWKQGELYEQLKVHDKMQKEFINVAAHELRTPIQPILGLAEVVRSKIKKEDMEASQLLDVISRNAKRLQRLTEDILDVTKIESQSLKLNKQYLNLKDIIMNVLADYKNEEQDDKHQRKIRLLYSSDNEQDIIVKADKERLIQVISNLLSNAIKFTNEGEISVDVKRDNIARLVIVNVIDTGQGIEPEILPRLFTKFATKSFSGTGLGLYISKSIIEAHGGKIWADNNPSGEKGATFSFSLPID